MDRINICVVMSKHYMLLLHFYFVLILGTRVCMVVLYESHVNGWLVNVELKMPECVQHRSTKILSGLKSFSFDVHIILGKKKENKKGQNSQGSLIGLKC